MLAPGVSSSDNGIGGSATFGRTVRSVLDLHHSVIVAVVGGDAEMTSPAHRGVVAARTVRPVTLPIVKMIIMTTLGAGPGIIGHGHLVGGSWNSGSGDRRRSR